MASAPDTTVLHGVTLRIADDSVVRSAAKHGEYEPESLAAWLAAVGDGWAVDVGAYTGLYSIAAAKAGARVLAVEPSPDACARLVDNLRLNHAPVSLVQAALWDRPDGRAVLSGKHKGITAASSLRGYADPYSTVTVRALRLDALVGPRRVTAIKIDTERTELDVLRGASLTLLRHHPVVIVEELDGRTAELEAFMLGHGYGPHERIDGRNLLYRRADGTV